MTHAYNFLFFLIGLEVKRELLEGELSSPKKLLLPFLAAIGGIIVPATIYVVMNWGDPVALDGWGIPVATDIAFALALLSVLGRRGTFSWQAHWNHRICWGRRVAKACGLAERRDLGSDHWGLICLWNRLHHEPLRCGARIRARKWRLLRWRPAGYPDWFFCICRRGLSGPTLEFEVPARIGVRTSLGKNVPCAILKASSPKLRNLGGTGRARES